MKNLIQINIKSFKQQTLTTYILFLKNILKKLNLNFFLINIPKKVKRITLLKSPHVHKKAREQFQIYLYKKVIYVKINKNLIYLKSLLLNKPKLLNITVKYLGK